MPDRERDFRPTGESSLWIVVLLVVAVLAAGAVWWRWSQKAEPDAPAAPSASSTYQPDAPPPLLPPAAPVPATPQYPVDTANDAPLPKLDDADAAVRSALADLLGSKSVASFLQVDGFVRRFVATVDNLPREQAASRVWPVQPAPSRFGIGGAGDVRTIGPDNGARYTPFVLFSESVDVHRAAAVYTRMYPLFQQAYEELGYPNRYFNDRMVAVIDHLLQTPEPAGPVQVRLTEVKGDVQGEVPSQSPWLRYEFVDPSLQSMSAGQKMMVRVGPVNERRLKARLSAFRKEIVAGAVAKK